MGASESKVAPVQLPAAQQKTAVVLKKGKAKAKKSGDETSVVKGAAPAPAPVKQNDYELAIRSCKELEFILETEFGSTGTTLHERITNSNASLPIELISEFSSVMFVDENVSTFVGTDNRSRVTVPLL